MNPSLFFVQACWQWRSPQLNVLNPTVGAGLPAITAYKPTNLSTECTHSNCGSELARESGLTVDQSLTECTRSNGGSWLASDGGLPADQPPTECTQSNCGSGLARESGLTVDQSPTEYTRSNCGSWLASDGGLQDDHPPTECTHSNCGSELARESGLPDNIKTTEQTPHINITPQPRLKYTNRYAITATTPCAVTYAYARIRRLTRLWVGLYRFPVTAKQ